MHLQCTLGLGKHLATSHRKCCTRYVCKFGQLSGGHRAGKGPFSFQSQRRAMPKNVQNMILLCLLHMVARLWSKSFKLGFSSTWTENFYMHKQDFEEAEESEIKFSTFVVSWGKQGNSRKIFTSASRTMLKPLTVWIPTNCKILKEKRIPDYLTCLLRNLYAVQETTVRTKHGKNWLVQNWERSTTWLYIATLLI